MSDQKEYSNILEYLYSKSLVLHDTSMFHPVLYFYFIDAVAHIDYTLGLLAYTYTSPRNIMSGEYLRWRIDEEKKGDRVYFGKFVNWLKKTHPDRFNRLPSLWQKIYDDEDGGSYRSFRIVLEPGSQNALSPGDFSVMVDQFFNNEFLKSLYSDASLGLLFSEFKQDVISPGI